jgi:hypothetical protein
MTSTIFWPVPGPRRLARSSRLAEARAGQTLEPIVIGDPDHADLIVYRGDTGRFRVNVTDSAGTPLDVSAAVFDCDIRLTPDSGNTITSLTVTPVAGTPSAVDVTVTADQARLLDDGVWDLEMTLAGEVITLLAGAVIVTDDVSRTGL